MKFKAAVACWSIVAITAWLANVSTAQVGNGKVSVAVTAIGVEESRDMRTDLLLLWNRNVRSRPIGHGLKACIKTRQGDLRGGGLMSCTLTLSLPRGKVSAAGIVHNINRYTLVITGGTGVYATASGPLFVRRVGDGIRRLTFHT